MKLNYNNKRQKKAFTLIELLIVIAIIGILFVVLVSRVDFATDKAKATGVQTDFRAFQVAFEQVSKENAGFATFGWDTGDKSKDSLWSGKTTPDGQAYSYANKDKDAGDRVKNSYDQGDANLNGIQEAGETWVGRKIYTEEWTGVWTLVNPNGKVDYSAVSALEAAINSNLDPKLHITIANPDASGKYFITMANQARDPWGKEYHGEYITNATVDNMDRGAIILYSDGVNGKNGSEHSIANGVVTVTVPGNNVAGQDDMSLIVCYTNANGYGETKTTTHGFSNNQEFLAGNNGNHVGISGNGGHTMLNADTHYSKTSNNDLVFRSNANFADFEDVLVNGVSVPSDMYTVEEGSIIVTIKGDYFKSMNNDSYTVRIVSKTGYAETNITVADTAPSLLTFNAPYVFTQDGMSMEMYFYANGSVIMLANGAGESLPANTFVYDGRYVYMIDGDEKILVCETNADGTEVTMEGITGYLVSDGNGLTDSATNNFVKNVIYRAAEYDANGIMIENADIVFLDNGGVMVLVVYNWVYVAPENAIITENTAFLTIIAEQALTLTVSLQEDGTLVSNLYDNQVFTNVGPMATRVVDGAVYSADGTILYTYNSNDFNEVERNFIIREGTVKTQLCFFTSVLARNIVKIYIPKSMQNISDLYNCNDLTDVYYGGTQEEWLALDCDIPDGVIVHYNASPSDVK